MKSFRSKLTSRIYSKDALFVFIILLVCIPIILPYTRSGFFPTHDGEWTVVRLSEMFREIRDGQFPARYSTYLNFGYGYPLFNFAYPMPYYLGLPFVLLKLGFLNTIKFLFAASVLISGIGMYWAASLIWKNKISGLVGAILYLYLPYRFVDLFVRGNIGEALAFALFPFLVVSVYKILTMKKAYGWSALLAILLMVFITIHNIAAVIFTPILLVLAGVIVLRRRENILALLLAFLLGIGAAAFFWMPALLEKHFIQLSIIPIADRSLYFVTLPRFILPMWGYGVPTDTVSPFTYQLGWPHLLLVIATVFLIGIQYKKFVQHDMMRILATVFIALMTVYILMMFQFTTQLWEIIPLLSEINYPWTLLGPIGFLACFITGYFVRQRAEFEVAGIVISVIAVLVFVTYAQPEKYIDRDDNFYITNDATTTSSRELTPVWVKEYPQQRPSSHLEVMNGEADIQNLAVQSDIITATIEAKTDTRIRINTIYYPGWQVYVNNEPTEIDYGNEYGVMEVKLREGSHQLKAEFSETPLRMLANSISLLSLLGSVGLIFINSLRKKDSKK